MVMVVGEGPTHRRCYELNAISQRQFGNLDLQTLDDELLNELKELVLTECNARQPADSNDIELFI